MGFECLLNKFQKLLRLVTVLFGKNNKKDKHIYVLLNKLLIIFQFHYEIIIKKTKLLKASL